MGILGNSTISAATNPEHAEGSIAAEFERVIAEEN